MIFYLEKQQLDCKLATNTNKVKTFRATSALVIVLLLASSLFSGCSTTVKTPTASVPKSQSGAPYNRPYKVRGKTYYPMASAVGYRAEGIAPWYGSESGNKTAMGTRFDPQGLTAAHKTLPLPTKVRVTNLRNGRSVNVIVNDRGPFKKNRIIDLSHGAAKKIGLQGLAEVRIEVIDTVASNP